MVPHFPVFADLGCNEAVFFFKSVLYCVYYLIILQVLCPAARIMSGEMNTMLSFTPNVASRVVNLTQSSMLSDSMMSD